MLEAVRRQLEQYGLATRDLGLIEAMLRAGHIAVALEGSNEADRDLPLAAFASQFSQTRLLVTSLAIPSDANLTLGTHVSYRHARESGHPGAIDAARGTLGPRFRGGDGEKVGIICQLRTTRSLAGAEKWEVWELPEDIGELRDGLLALWLGTDAEPPHRGRGPVRNCCLRL